MIESNDNDSTIGDEHENVVECQTTERSDCEQQAAMEDTELEDIQLDKQEDTCKDKEDNENIMEDSPMKAYEFSIDAEDKFTLMMQDLHFQLSSLK